MSLRKNERCPIHNSFFCCRWEQPWRQREFASPVREGINRIRACRFWRGIPEPTSQETRVPISPTPVGAELLRFAMPPTIERAFGYRGDLRFLQFGYPAARRQFGFSDGGDDLASDKDLWSWFLYHPVVTPHLAESRYPTLYGRFASETGKLGLDLIMRSGIASPVCHCSPLDRRERQAYISQTRSDDDSLCAHGTRRRRLAHGICVLMSAGSESYKLPPSVEFVDELRRFLDGQIQVPAIGDRLPVEP
jgi:hypothetical protein